jgi:hypothetical protein
LKFSLSHTHYHLLTQITAMNYETQYSYLRSPIKQLSLSPTPPLPSPLQTLLKISKVSKPKKIQTETLLPLPSLPPPLSSSASRSPAITGMLSPLTTTLFHKQPININALLEHNNVVGNISNVKQVGSNNELFQPIDKLNAQSTNNNVRVVFSDARQTSANDGNKTRNSEKKVYNATLNGLQQEGPPVIHNTPHFESKITQGLFNGNQQVGNNACFEINKKNTDIKMKNGETKRIQKIVINKKVLDIERAMGENKKKAEIYYRSHMASLLNDLGGMGGIRGGLEEYLNFSISRKNETMPICVKLYISKTKCLAIIIFFSFFVVINISENRVRLFKNFQDSKYEKQIQNQNKS